MSLLNQAYTLTSSFLNTRSKDDRKKYGQFFTSVKTAEFMANLFSVNIDKPTIKMLDAGAGTGLLTVALVNVLRNKGYKGNISVTCYENDDKVIPVLKENLDNLKRTLRIEYEIIDTNYLLSQKFDGGVETEKDSNIYDLVIGNPPYLKIGKDAPEAKAMPSVCYGAPNLYFLFWAMSIQYLGVGGELVYIIPRSWTSGAYFEKFREFLFENCVITNIHIFGSRDKVFDGESVLQETMIIKIRKTKEKPQYVEMSSCESSNFDGVKYYNVDYNVVVAPNHFVYLVTNEEEAGILSRINRLPETLVSNDLRMRTGIVVDFRTQEVLRNKEEESSYPLLYSQHIRNGRVIWPVGRDSEYIVTDRSGLLQDNSDYLLVKRFTAKEEKRRLQSGIYLKSDYQQYKYISTQNKINYIKCDSPDLAYGLYVIFNSSIYDSYYRILNGSTQVNSTEINLMPVPPRKTIEEMGRELMGQELTEANCNTIIDRWIR